MLAMSTTRRAMLGLTIALGLGLVLTTQGTAQEGRPGGPGGFGGGFGGRGGPDKKFGGGFEKKFDKAVDRKPSDSRDDRGPRTSLETEPPAGPGQARSSRQTRRPQRQAPRDQNPVQQERLDGPIRSGEGPEGRTGGERNVRQIRFDGEGRQGAAVDARRQPLRQERPAVPFQRRAQGPVVVRPRHARRTVEPRIRSGRKARSDHLGSRRARSRSSLDGSGPGTRPASTRSAA